MTCSVGECANDSVNGHVLCKLHLGELRDIERYFDERFADEDKRHSSRIADINDDYDSCLEAFWLGKQLIS